VRVSSFVSIGPAVWPAIRNKQTDRQTDKHIAFYYIDGTEHDQSCDRRLQGSVLVQTA